MNLINIKNNNAFLEEYLRLCHLEWGNSDKELDMKKKINDITNNDKVISVLGLVDGNTLIGFISLFKYDGSERSDLTPWYATMYVKEEYRGKEYSKILNDAILKEAYDLGYAKVYLKSKLVNYYEKFGAHYIETLANGEKLYYLNTKNI